MKATPPNEIKQERAKKTRKKILAAAVEVLSTSGAAASTTTAIARKAGVSQGALFKHFPTKGSLMAATTESLFDTLFEDFHGAFEGGVHALGADRMDVVLRGLWQVFLSPTLYAVVELYLGARHDPGLRAALVPVVTQHRTNLMEEATRLFPAAASDNPRFEGAIDSIMSAMQGAAISGAVVQDPVAAKTVYDFVEYVCRRELGFLEGEGA